MGRNLIGLFLSTCPHLWTETIYLWFKTKNQTETENWTELSVYTRTNWNHQSEITFRLINLIFNIENCVLYCVPQVLDMLVFFITVQIAVNILHMFILYSLWKVLKFLDWLITPRIHNSIHVAFYCNDLNSAFS